MRTYIERALAILDKISWLAPLLTRLVFGITLFGTGKGKLANFDKTVSFFTDLGIPFPAANAGFVSSLEMIGGIFLVLGLLTRPFALALMSTMVVALLTADRQSFIDNLGGDLTTVTPVPFFLALLWLLCYGPGIVSLDAFLFKRLGIRQTPLT